MVIELSLAEMALAHQIAANRQIVNEAVGVKDSRRDGGTVGAPIRLHLLGAAAELAFAKWQNVYPDLSAHPRRGTPDFVIRGNRIDVKARPGPAGPIRRDLVVPINKQLSDADIYVLGFVDDNAVDFASWAYSHEVICEANITDLKYGPCYVLPAPNLRPFTVAAL